LNACANSSGSKPIVVISLNPDSIVPAIPAAFSEQNSAMAGSTSIAPTASKTVATTSAGSDVLATTVGVDVAVGVAVGGGIGVKVAVGVCVAVAVGGGDGVGKGVSVAVSKRAACVGAVVGSDLLPQATTASKIIRVINRFMFLLLPRFYVMFSHREVYTDGRRTSKESRQLDRTGTLCAADKKSARAVIVLAPASPWR
jgi:hypothetical protein